MEPATLKNILKKHGKNVNTSKDNKIKMLLVGLTFQVLDPLGMAGLRGSSIIYPWNAVSDTNKITLDFGP